MQTCIWPSRCHCHSLSLASVKSRLVLPFWYQLTWVVPDKGPLNGCVFFIVVCLSQSADGDVIYRAEHLSVHMSIVSRHRPDLQQLYLFSVR